MTNRVQVLRSNAKGVRPAVGSREPGELFVNWPDQQIGVIDSTRSPIDLLAVRNFSATADYVVGDLVVRGGDIYRAAVAITAGPWDGTKWTDIVHETDKHHGVTLFDPSRSYLQNELVAQSGNIYRAKSSVRAGAFNVAQWDLLSPTPTGVKPFSINDAYAKDDLVSNGGVIYRAKAPVSSGAFIAAEWEDISTPTDAVRVFDPAKAYAANDLVSYMGKIYRATAAVAVGPWAAASWEDININTAHGVTPFDATKAYALNDLVTYQGKIYRARVATIAAGAWKSNDWHLVGGNVSIGATAPVNAEHTDLWWKSDEGQLYVYYDDGSTKQWVQAGPTPPVQDLTPYETTAHATATFETKANVLARGHTVEVGANYIVWQAPNNGSKIMQCWGLIQGHDATANFPKPYTSNPTVTLAISGELSDATVSIGNAKVISTTSVRFGMYTHVLNFVGGTTGSVVAWVLWTAIGPVA